MELIEFFRKHVGKLKTLLLAQNAWLTIWLTYQQIVQIQGNGKVTVVENNPYVLIGETGLILAVAVFDVILLFTKLRRQN